jgi:ABC-type uncharacterized transport system involved in gliding motility auxiliary subunit
MKKFAAWLKTRQAKFALYTFIYTLVVLLAVGVVNYLAKRYNKSYDATSTKKFTLSDQTIKIAKNLKDKKVTISYWSQPTKFTAARDLLDRYKNLTSNIDVQYIDADKAVTEAMAENIRENGAIFVKVGDRKEEAKSLTEVEVTSAIVRALKGGKRTVCFVAGAGEHTLDDTSRDGASKAKETIEQDNYKTQVINLAGSDKIQIPAECTVTVIAGPQRGYPPPVVEALKNYVEGGGRALFLLDPPLKFGRAVDDNQGLVDVLSGWGVTPEKDLVLDAIGAENFRQPGLAVVISYEQHVIVADLKKKQEASGFLLARSLDVKNGNKTSVEKLFSTTKRSLGVKNLASAEIARSKDDLPGPLTLAAAGTYNTGKEEGKGLFVVVGNSRWITNGSLDFYGNSDLLLNTLNWLSSDEDLISIRPRENKDRRLVMNEKQVSLVFYGSVIGIPLLILIAGVGVWWRRR